jgi:hypothetical protein
VAERDVSRPAARGKVLPARRREGNDRGMHSPVVSAGCGSRRAFTSSLLGPRGWPNQARELTHVAEHGRARPLKPGRRG